MGIFDSKNNVVGDFGSDKMRGYPQGTTATSGEPSSDVVDASGAQGVVNKDGGGDEAVVEVNELPLPDTQDYLADWGSGISLSDAAANSDRSRLDLIRDRERWSRETGGAPLDIFDLASMAHGHDLTKSAAEDEKAEKKRANQEKWEQIGNVLSHLGNFVGTIAGAPVQPVEDAVELTKRQQALRERTQALRRQENNDLLTLYYKQRAEQRAADVAAANAAYQRSQLAQGEKKLEIAQQREDRMEAQMWLNEQFRDRKMTFEEGRQAALQAYRNGMLSQGAARIAISRMNAEGYTVEKTETKVDSLGREHEVKSNYERRPNGGGVQKKALPGSGKKRLPGQ